MKLVELKTKSRKMTGNGPARVLRRNNEIPAILYGRNRDTVKLSINNKELELAIKESSSKQVFVDLILENENSETTKVLAMIKDLQRHPTKHTFLHVDFYQIDTNRQIKIKVPVNVIGKSKGVEKGGLLQIIRREIEIKCLPLETPTSIDLDIADLEIGDAIHVQDIPLTGRMEIVADVNYTVVTVLSPKADDEDEATSESEEEELAATDATGDETS